ncbi:MAG: hypothetical protein ACTSO9_04795 [Candidatus Helarchaeota archaeon]
MKKIPLIIFLLGYIVVIFINISLYIKIPNNDLATFIPGSAFVDFFLLATLQPVYLIVFYFIFGDLMTMLYFPLHKLVKFFKYEYKHVELGTEFSTYDYLMRLAVPSLFCYSLLFMVSGFILPLGLFIGNKASSTMVLIALNFIFLPISCTLNSGAWILDDTGVICHLKPEYYNKRKPPIIEGVGRYWNSTWTGLIGYTTPIGIAMQIYRGFIEGIPWQATLMLILLPFVLMCLTIPVILIHDGQIKGKKNKLIKMWNIKEIPKSTLEIQ